MTEADSQVPAQEEMERCATIYNWSRELNLSITAINKRITELASIPALDSRNRIVQCYPESIIRKYCSDLLAVMLEADDTGFFVLNGKKYGTLTAWERI